MLRRSPRSAAPTSKHLPHRLEIRARDGVVGVQLEGPLPAANRLVALLPPQPNVAELEIRVVAERGIQLRRADERIERLVITAGAVVEITEVLMELRERGVL